MDDATAMMRLMHKRAGLIAKGYYHAVPPVYKALPVGETRARARKVFLTAARKAALAQAQMERSDPFLYARAMQQMKAGIIAPHQVPLNRRIAF